MTDRSEDGNYLVRVRAQVMSRDDSSGGWVPLGGGGLSDVSVRRRPRPQGAGPPDKPKHDYLICGKRISDNSVVLSCTIKKDFEYNKVMPTFHHWRTGSKRFGLTFQAAADARAFDKGVRTAVEDLLDGFSTTPPSMILPKCPREVDDDVFMTLDLPRDPKDSRSSTDSNSSGKSGAPEHLHRITYVGKDKPAEPPKQPTYDPQKAGAEYVQLQPRHEYFYVENPLSQQPPLPPTWESPTALKKASPPLPPQPLAEVFKPVVKRPQHFVCRHCNEPFTRDQNKRGSCKYAPDAVRSVVHWLSCLPLINCSMYHCAADSEGDFQTDPCRCRGEDEPRDACARRWVGLAFFSMVVPCIWLYPPLRLCHACGVRCGVWGGRHKASSEAA
ncbi:sprouty-related, EVH1 domain-containing protein 1 isoform X1 [Sitophilus oryzae]|uniref:Sprouty-related, EVH1 domain-containing protein 1 isoform X1 n=1 Tax=Sitophilus oryzae TaxID=7048 RepID=A0A6J2Y200_SITOR|nr:sprouty-related, EVH1 domain-containing protein 1 isoform X1 [Sitophilus oryzae]